MNAAKTITAALAAMFAEFDAAHLVNTIAWANKAHAALVEFDGSDEAKAGNEWTRYARRYAICGGKGMYQIVRCGTKDRNEMLTKNHEMVIAKRNAKIAAKLAAVEVGTVESADVTRSDDGFNGVFKVATDKGVSTVIINTIVAGGYNIQCAHYRTLVKVR